MKKNVLFALAIVLISFTGYLLYKIVKTKQQYDNVNATKQTLPNFSFYNLDSVATNNSFIKRASPFVFFILTPIASIASTRPEK